VRLKKWPFINLVLNDLERVEALLREHPPEQYDVIGMAVDRLVSGGGKRLRPTLVLLSAHLCGAELERAVFAAAAVEMLHTATLVHDDLIDGSLTRRGVETLNARWSPSVTVLTGDYMFAHAAYLASRTADSRLMQRFAETLILICNGEVQETCNGRRSRVSREEYERHIYAKTASLIGMSAEAGAILAGADEGTTEALRSYGEQLGLAFQIVDDVLDLVAEEGALGKPLGSDLRQGVITLPLLLFLEMEPDHPSICRALQENPPKEVVQEAARIVAGSPSIEQALEVACQHANRAGDALNRFLDSPYKTALLDLTDFAVRRRF